MKTFFSGLNFWKRPLTLLTLVGVAIFLMIPSGNPILWVPGIPIMLIGSLLFGIDLYGHLAERHFRNKKLDADPETDYKKTLRQLKRARRKKVREAFSYKNYGSGNTYHREALELDRKIEAHKNGEDYVAPKARGRY